MSQLTKHGTALREYFTTKLSRKYLGNRSVGENTVNINTNKSKKYNKLGDQCEKYRQTQKRRKCNLDEYIKFSDAKMKKI